MAVCGLGRTTAASAGVEVVVTPASAALAYQDKSLTTNVELATGGGTVDGSF